MLSEQSKLQFRAEVFNLLNRANFGLANTQTFPGSVATVAGNPAVPSVIAQSPISNSPGVITNTATEARQIQLSVRFSF
jgi:hypothetical protein